MSLLNDAKSLWRRSVRIKDQSAHRKESFLGIVSASHPTKPVTFAVIGCGQRGKSYSRYALLAPEQCKVVAIAEPRLQTRKNFAKRHSVDQTLVFETWQELHVASAETIKTVGTRLADAIIIAVHDHMHAEVVLAFAEQGYHILCEKPMATTMEDCLTIEAAVKKADIIFGMGHVLRYSPYSKAISEIVQSGSLGQLVNIVQVEPVGYYHFAHSYVRGNWANEKTSSFSLMTKSCHDIDLISSWMSPSIPTRVSSFGSLQHFRKSAKPAAADDAVRCLECRIQRECPYSAKRIYLDPVTHGQRGWPVETIVDGLPDIENVMEALKTGPYGKCVYECENDVCDHQVVNLEFSNGSTASFTMVAFTSTICERQLRMHFTHGEIVGDMSKFTVTDFRKNHAMVHHPEAEGGGHGGGDLGLIRTFVEAVRTGRQDVLGTDVGEVLKNHFTTFAAEHSRREGKVVDCAKFEKSVKESIASKSEAGPLRLPEC